jgi:undecaprenyl-phosphate 4-deoxy-4-formamido-L-arabinose transferase
MSTPDVPGGTAPSNVQRLSIVVPVFQGERTLEPLLSEIEPLTKPRETPRGRHFEVVEVVLVHDGAIDGSQAVMHALAARFPFVTLVWLSRNFGQHPATLAGMSVTSADWVATLDEDGQQDPAELGAMLDRALGEDVALVYADPLNPPPHGPLRNALSRSVKVASSVIVGTRQMSRLNSFRLIRGDIARSLAAYCGHGVYLDVALSWIVGRWTTCPVRLRPERGRASGYTFGKLAAHFGRLVLTAGTRPLRIISILGFLSVVLGMALSVVIIWAKLTRQIPVQGYTSLLVAICFFSGVILFSLGVIAEYLGVTLTMAMGRPLYVTVSRPGPRDSPSA